MSYESQNAFKVKFSDEIVIGGGTIDPSEIERIVEEYLEENPPEPGPQGPKGDDGYTPRRGIDYFTEADIEYIINAVLAALGSGGETEDYNTAELGKAILDTMILV